LVSAYFVSIMDWMGILEIIEMVAWKDLDPAVLETMEKLGYYPYPSNIIPIVWNDEDEQMNVDDLKHMANHLMIVSRWLEQRADEERIKK